MEISKSNFDFNDYARLRRTIIEEKLAAYMRLQEPKLLWESMAYSVLSGGKRLRALLCIAAAECCGSESGSDAALQAVLPCACAIELIHAMSLIHDDLPALDNDDLRRGKPTNHKVFGEAVALLAGDALLMLAMGIILEETPLSTDREKVIAVSLELSRAAGASGMVGGQVDDLRYTGQIEVSEPRALTHQQDLPAETAVDEKMADDNHINESVLASIHKRKTGALIRFAAWSGAYLAGGSESQVSTISEFAEILGLAFQIADDVLDITGDAHTLGKTPGKDEASKKATWVRLFGKDESVSRLKSLEQRGLELLQNGDINQSSAEALGALLSYAVHRKH